MDRTPSGSSSIGMDGLPIFPRTGSPRRIRPSSSRFFRMVETVGFDSPVRRARSAAGNGPVPLQDRKYQALIVVADTALVHASTPFPDVVSVHAAHYKPPPSQ